VLHGLFDPKWATLCQAMLEEQKDYFMATWRILGYLVVPSHGNYIVFKFSEDCAEINKVVKDRKQKQIKEQEDLMKQMAANGAKQQRPPSAAQADLRREARNMRQHGQKKFQPTVNTPKDA
jgi:hypothetical protein